MHLIAGRCARTKAVVGAGGGTAVFGGFALQLGTVSLDLLGSIRAADACSIDKNV